MKFDLILKPSAEKELEKLDSRYKSHIVQALVEIRKNPHQGKKLKGEKAGEWSYRVGPYRLIYEIYYHEPIIIIIRVGHRQGVY